jgi:uncharacterized alkaline shock family protein YloU
MADKIDGAIHIANDVLADLVGYSALESYGVVGMANPNVADGVAKLLARRNLRKGVVITASEAGVEVDLYVVIEHGTNLGEVSHNLANRARHVLTAVADVAVARVDVHVIDVKVRTAK